MEGQAIRDGVQQLNCFQLKRMLSHVYHKRFPARNIILKQQIFPAHQNIVLTNESVSDSIWIYAIPYPILANVYPAARPFRSGLGTLACKATSCSSNQLSQTYYVKHEVQPTTPPTKSGYPSTAFACAARHLFALSSCP